MLSWLIFLRSRRPIYEFPVHFRSFSNFFYKLQGMAFNFQGDSCGVIFTYGCILWPGIAKNTLLDFKIHKTTQLLINWRSGKPPFTIENVINSRLEIQKDNDTVINGNTASSNSQNPVVSNPNSGAELNIIAVQNSATLHRIQIFVLILHLINYLI